MKGMLHLIGTGGAGINATMSMVKDLKELGDKFSDIKASYLDTTDKTIKAYPSIKDEFIKIESTKASGAKLDGMGGERANLEVAKEINTAVRTYVDKLPNEKNIYYVVIASGSGASGSLISPLLVRAMKEQGFNVVMVLIGDSSNLLNLNNTINTIATLQHNCVRINNRALSVIYYNNTVNRVTTPVTERSVNDKIFQILSILSLYCSGNIQNIDHQDMNYFFEPSRYTSLDINPGLFNIGLAINKLVDENTLLARTIVKEDTDDVQIEIPLRHNKMGVVTGELMDHYKDYPMFLLLRKNIMNMEMKHLKKELEELEIYRQTEYDEFDNIDTSEVDDGLGLVV